ncbi:protein pleiotropic regulatory locus 1-like [Ipomoea triloba]|uniref:protein pleiotropic regulatory locus 1-like n=1 Tax=Ipomoea triloba TaxID=35885 RepID=UPI00125D73B2|nr:protein pleiotropic regulatory locus 1-like [Ipomoea triloba]
MDSELAVEPQSLKKLSFKSLKRALDLFSPLHGHFPPSDPESKKIRISHKLNIEYAAIASKAAQPHSNSKAAAQNQAQKASAPSNALALPGPENARDPQKGVPKNELAVGPSLQPKSTTDGFAGRSTAVIPSQHTSSERNLSTAAIMERIPSKWPRPAWHPPWKNYRVISGHLGWVRSVAVDHSNSWFCTGSADRTIKIWDLATGTLKLTLTGHIEQIRDFGIMGFGFVIRNFIIVIRVA